jgi:hypothetical protein
MYTVFWWGNHLVSDHFEDQEGDRKIILKCILRKTGCEGGRSMNIAQGLILWCTLILVVLKLQVNNYQRAD